MDLEEFREQFSHSPMSLELFAEWAERELEEDCEVKETAEEFLEAKTHFENILAENEIYMG
jgi:hypothetical protein